MKIRTEYYPKPIPIRSFDWTAIDEDNEEACVEACVVGYGKTEEEAVRDLLEMIADEPRGYRQAEAV